MNISRSEVESKTLLSTAADDPMVGKVFGDKFRIIAKQGSGGLSDVYKALDVVSTRMVAIKILRITKETTRHGFELFTSNAKLTLNHPCLVTTIASGITDDGEPWLALEWLDNAETLAQLLSREGTLPYETIKAVFSQIGDALNYAHSQGEVHMNLKPSNIILVERDGKLFVKISDFSYAKMLMERELEMADEKAPARGSPLYMSPEQFKGTRIDSRADIYAVGCMIYESMIGRPPHQGVDLLETMDRHMNIDVSFPSEPETTAQMQAVLSRMLAKESTQRHRSMQEVLTDFEGALAGQFPKVEVRPKPSFPDERGVDFITAKRGTARPKGREPWMMLIACLTVLLFVVMVQQCMLMVQEYQSSGHSRQR